MGEQAINTLQVGDHVLAYDPATQTTSTQTVLHVFVNHDTGLIDITLHTDPVRPSTDATSGKTKEQEAAIVSHGSQAPLSPTTTEVVHTTQNHPWLTTQGWIKAGDLHVGAHIQRLDRTTATVVALTVVAGEQDRYDLMVSHIHTFAVGEPQVVVHNCTDRFQQLVKKNWTKNVQ